MLAWPPRRSFFSFARLVRIRFASLSASILWVRERSGALEADLVAAGMGGDYTHAPALRKTTSEKTCANPARPPAQVEQRLGSFKFDLHFRRFSVV